jgi:hypothetical protein
MGVDRPDDFDVPSDGASDRGRAGSPSDGSAGRVVVETRDRFEYYESLRFVVADSASASAPADTFTSADSSTSTSTRASSDKTRESWEVVAERFRGDWTKHCQRWPAEGRSAVDRSEDPPGSWRGESGRYLDSAANAEVEERCDRIAETERSVVSPAMREIEACDPERRLVGFEHRLKGQDRIKDKVAVDIHLKSRTTEEAFANVKDAVRYTLQYDEARYTEGVRGDIERLKAQGFQQVELRNSWADDRYKGINSRWRDPDSGLLCEVQFHTRMSFEAKQLTHGAYERLRNPLTTDAEREELDAFQRDVCGHIAIPGDATDIPDFP